MNCAAPRAWNFVNLFFIDKKGGGVRAIGNYDTLAKLYFGMVWRSAADINKAWPGAMAVVVHSLLVVHSLVVHSLLTDRCIGEVGCCQSYTI